MPRSFFSQLVQFIEAELEAQGFEMLVADSHGEVDREARRLRMLVARGIEGIIVIPSDAERSGEALRRLAPASSWTARSTRWSRPSWAWTTTWGWNCWSIMSSPAAPGRWR